MTEPLPGEMPLVEAARYSRLSQARERALVVAAMELPHSIEREGRSFLLKVEAPALAAVTQELEKFEIEQRQRGAASPEAELPLPKLQTLSLYVAAWFLIASWVMQNWQPAAWEAAGRADSAAITSRGEWWRAATALTLHGDLSHLVANIAFGLLFSAFLLPRLGTGLTWLAIVLSGIVGNLLNAYFHRSAPHLSIGASTAVFGALGILVGLEFVTRFASPATRSRWQLVVPIGAGFALLAFLGTGEENGQQTTDYMAHLFGLLSGGTLGLAVGWSSLATHFSRTWQRITAAFAPALILLSWWLAYQKEN